MPTARVLPASSFQTRLGERAWLDQHDQHTRTCLVTVIVARAGTAAELADGVAGPLAELTGCVTACVAGVSGARRDHQNQNAMPASATTTTPMATLFMRRPNQAKSVRIP